VIKDKLNASQRDGNLLHKLLFIKILLSAISFIVIIANRRISHDRTQVYKIICAVETKSDG